MRQLGILMLTLTLLSCSKMEVETVGLPNIKEVSPSTIVSELSVINIEIDPDEFSYMMDNLWTSYVANIGFETLFVGERSESVKGTMEFKGNGSLGENYPAKSMGIVLESPIQTNAIQEFEYPLNKGIDLSEVSAFKLRNSGQDMGVTMLKDLVYNQYAEQMDLDLEVMFGAPIQVFVNDEYYSILNLRNDIGIIGLSEMLKVNQAEISILKVGRHSEEFNFHDGNELAAEKLVGALVASDNIVIREEIDRSNFIDYILYEDYIGNTDWDVNIKLYKNGENPFRFLLYDLDFSGNKPKYPLLDKLEFFTSDLGKVYRAFQEDPTFEKDLKERRAVLYSRFSSQGFNRLVSNAANNLDDEMQYLVAKYEMPSSVFKWKMNLENLQENFESRDMFLRDLYELN